ncbi:GntR family transcriptional regulator [Maribius pontilimi]|uniref:GntR family transcriptional regulator n=1 Tax=Palleronia pontilimi TaxID=1964209 RepID=A0A934IGJ2_9RHOB|nr:GntR family transcriptional regulator [Palleronia pontilimi]MBJ3762416.1 GntR family transcriptional regulator [Palleronia pontilimi]
MPDDARHELPEGGKARRVYLLLRDAIASGAHGPGALLPGEHAMTDTYQVSRVTVRRALDALERDGLIDRRAGSGTRVLAAPATAAMSADMSTLIPQLVSMGQHSARLLSFSYDTPPDRIAREMGIAPGARVQMAVRVRLVDGAPFSHLTTFVPEDIAANYSEADLAGTPLYQLLERSGVVVAAAHQSVSATLAGPEVADALGVATGTALMSLNRIVRDDDQRVVEYLSALYRPDRFKLEMSLSRVGKGSARHWEPVVGDRGAEGAP